MSSDEQETSTANNRIHKKPANKEVCKNKLYNSAERERADVVVYDEVVAIATAEE